jgi:hypothetical protein
VKRTAYLRTTSTPPILYPPENMLPRQKAIGRPTMRAVPARILATLSAFRPPRLCGQRGHHHDLPGSPGLAASSRSMLASNRVARAFLVAPFTA